MLDTPISRRFQKGKTLISLEFFPPKNEALAQELLDNAERIATHVQPDYVSITYGQGGQANRLTFLYTQILRDRFDWAVMPHLTCVGHTRDELLAIAESYERIGVKNIMALRGDAPVVPVGTPPPFAGEFHYANDLVKLLKDELPEMCLAVAGYPEKHPSAPSRAEDLQHLREKVEAGGSFIITQMFFDNRHYFEFVEQCRAAGITVPVVAGIMPVYHLAQARQFCQACGVQLPPQLARELDAVPENAQWHVGVDWALRQIKELIEAKVPGIHLYVLNRSQSIVKLTRELREKEMLP